MTTIAGSTRCPECRDRVTGEGPDPVASKQAVGRAVALHLHLAHGLDTLLDAYAEMYAVALILLRDDV